MSRLSSTLAKVKLKGIDGDPHKRWSMWFNSDMTYADFVQEKEYYGKTTASVYGANGQSAITYNIRTFKAAIPGDEINSIFNIVKS